MSAERGEPAPVRICDLAGRPRGTGFMADDLGTLVTSHEAVDGLNRAVVHAPGERTFLAESGDITPLPEWDLALVRTEGLGLAPLVIGAERPRTGGTGGAGGTGGVGTEVVLGVGGAVTARLNGTVSATYTSTDRFHPLEQVLELALPEAACAQLRLSRRASGTPVLDVATGAVLGVLGTALHVPGRTAGYAVPLCSAGVLAPDGPLGVLLRRNGASVPGFGPDLNLAGALQLTATSVGRAVERCAHAVARPEIAEEFTEFAGSGASVAGLVGDPGTGRTTELAAFAARRARGTAPEPTVWLRGADLRAGDGSVREAVGRALDEAARIVAASRGAGPEAGPEASAEAGPDGGRPPGANPDVVARLARDARRPLLVLLDAPEEMPPQLAHGLRQWTVGTSSWLRASGARLAVACRPEHWEQAGALFPRDMLYVPRGAAWSGGAMALEAGPGPGSGPTGPGQGGAVLPPCVRLGDLPPRQAVRARAGYGLPDGALADADAGHPLAIRMLSEVRAAQASRDVGTDRVPRQGGPPDGQPVRAEILSAHLDLVCLRIAVRLAAGERSDPGAGAGGVRRRAARVAGQLHEAARRCLGPGQGGLDRASFEEIFPWGGGWASAVLGEGVLVPAGGGYRFADEEFADWIQGRHLELDGALDALVHRRDEQSVAIPVPRHRIGPVVQSLLLCGRRDGPGALVPRLRPLVDALAPGDAGEEAAWWAAHLLGETLLRVPDARPYAAVLRALAERIAGLVDGARFAEGPLGHGFGPWFWRRLPLDAREKAELLRLLLPADSPYGEGDRFLDVLGELLVAGPRAVQPLLCEWFSDLRALPRREGSEGGEGADGVDGRLAPTVATAAQALLHTHRRHAVDDLVEALVGAAHPRADELLAELVHDEPSALCRAVDRWAHDDRVERRAAAAMYGVRVAVRARTEADRELLRYAALALLRRPGDCSLHGPALALLVRDPASRSRFVDAALARFGETGEPELASALGTALATHPEPVLAAFHTLLTEDVQASHESHAGGVARARAVRALAEVRTPALARRAALLVRAYAECRPDEARGPVAGFVRRRLGHGPSARGVLRPLVAELLASRTTAFRASLARVLGAGEGVLRDELLEMLLAGERDLRVLDAALSAVARLEGGRGRERLAGETVRRVGLAMARTPEGAAGFDRALVELAREVPGFAAALRGWVAGAPGEWAALIGPSARRMCETLAEAEAEANGT
ncbi:trypsin-like peptidase domain-containing protein [Streptomyces sp. NPDC048172]|uniref:trypsin-like peptidase domain-containing protein n=1 Tax=Streptomyces sp. NPDC048172 TaxID=3365505 RepID=UPI00371CB644